MHSLLEPFLISPYNPGKPGFPFFRRLVNIALASLMAFAVCGSAACALRIVLSY